MKRLNKSLTTYLPPVSVFREDIIAIAEALKQNDGKLRLKTEKFEYDSLDELLANSEDPLFKMSLARDEPHISVDFDGFKGVWLYSRNDDLLSKAIFFELQSLLESKRKWSHLVLTNFLKICGWLAPLGGGALAVIGNWTAALICFMFVPLEIIFSFAKHKSTISRDLRVEQKNFWQRNSDQIFIALVGALAGGLITLAITFIFPSNQS